MTEKKKNPDEIAGRLNMGGGAWSPCEQASNYQGYIVIQPSGGGKYQGLSKS